MRRFSAFILGSVVIFSILIGCSPKIMPTPTPAPTLTTSAPATIPAIVSSPQDTAWAKVVEAAKKEGSLIMYGSSTVAGPAGQALMEAFQNRYGIRLEILQVSGRVGLEKIRVEQQMKRTVADLGQFGLSALYDLVNIGVVVNVAKELPELKNRDVFTADVVDMDGQILYIDFSQTDLMVNSKLVKPQDEPQSYYDLLDPKWKGGKLILSDPRSGGSSGWNWFSTSTYYKALDYDYFQRFMKQEVVLSAAATTAIATAVARGEHLMTVTSVDSTVHLAVAGAPLKYLALKEGSWVVGNGIVVIKNAPHPNAAKLYTNWMLSQEGIMTWARAASRSGVRKDVPDFMPQGISPEPKRVFIRTVEVMQAGENLLKAGTVNEVFGPK